MPSPDTWSDYRPDCNGWWNSTIIGKAGYLMGRDPTEGSETHRGIAVTGIGEADTSAVFYDALTEKLAGSATFSDFRNAALQSCIDTGASSLTSCMNAIRAVGLWSTDVNAWTLPTGSTSVDLASIGSTRFAFNSRIGNRGVEYRARTCPVSDGGCSWTTETSIGEPDAEGVPAVSTNSENEMFVCFRVRFGAAHNLWCDHFHPTSGPEIGPDPTTSDVRDSPTLAFFNGEMYIAYRVTSGAIHWRRINKAHSTWSAPLSVHPSVSTFHSPVLASGDEDPVGGAPDSLFLLYVIGSGLNQNRIAYVPFNPVTDSWDFASGGVLQEENNTPAGPFTDYYMTNEPVGAAFFRGRLHVVATDVGLNEIGGDDTLWYGSCGIPCNEPPDWTRLVQQDGGAQTGAGLDTWGAQESVLRIWRRLASSDMMAHRLKDSE